MIRITRGRGCPPLYTDVGDSAWLRAGLFGEGLQYPLLVLAYSFGAGNCKGMLVQ